jgi:hypothetical protein
MGVGKVGKLTMDTGPFCEMLAYTNNLTLWDRKCITPFEIQSFTQG